jgi:hypothetical protein
MFPRHDIIKWTLSGALALLLLGGMLSLAERWLMGGAGRPPPAVPAWNGPEGWLTFLPREVEVDPFEPDRRASAPPAAEPWVEAPWWRLAWEGTFVPASSSPAMSTGRPDSVQLALARLGLAADFAERARPDSVLAARLIRLSRREGYLPADVRPLLLSIGRAKAYRAVVSRAAEMYDEFLAQEIITTD